MKGKKYIYNVKTKKLHKFQNEHCFYSNSIPTEHKFYNTEDEAIAENKKYMSYCKNCFGGR